MALVIDTRTGPVVNSDGPGNQPLRQSRMASLVTADGHSRFFEIASRGFLYSAGSTVTALSANTIGTGATATPIVGVWNPLSSTVGLVVVQASIMAFPTAASFTGPGSFVWASATSQSAISTGALPFSHKTLTTGGSQARAFNGGVALTGLSGSLTIFEGADFITAGNTAITAGTTVQFSMGGVQNFDGSLIVPPGGVLALLNTTSTTTVSLASRLLWEEVPMAAIT
jgi:hypothetical protein